MTGNDCLPGRRGRRGDPAHVLADGSGGATAGAPERRISSRFQRPRDHSVDPPTVCDFAHTTSSAPARAAVRYGPGMRTLYLLRHGDAEPKSPGGNDHERSLAPEGRRAAERVGAHVAQRSVLPTLLLCSSARRAVETLEAVRPSLPETSDVLCERGLYLAGSDQIFRRICALDDRHAAVLVVGHNPGIGRLAHGLARPSPSGDFERLERGFPAAALAVLIFDIDRWLDIAPLRARLAEFKPPTRLASTR